MWLMLQGHWYSVKGRGLEPPEIKLLEDEPDRPVSAYLKGLIYCNIAGPYCNGL